MDRSGLNVPKQIEWTELDQMDWNAINLAQQKYSDNNTNDD